MHIPDGYLGPETLAAGWAITVPVWYRANRRTRQLLSQPKMIPLLAFGAAFSFLVMMLNVPVAGGTTAHAMGAVLIAVIAGPDIACLAVSAALVIQAFFFGDGGVLTLGVNVLNMAIVMPYAGYAIYRLTRGDSDLQSSRRLWAAGIGAYCGLVAAAFLNSIELGIQPLLHTVNGVAQYFPYGLKVTIPAMVGSHALIVGPVEVILTVGVFAVLRRQSPELFAAAGTTRPLRRRWIAALLALFIAAVPLGLLASGGAFAEWDKGELGKKLGYVPQGFARLGGHWRGLLPDYSWSGANGAWVVVAYIVSALVGVAVLMLIVWLLVRLRRRAAGTQLPAETPDAPRPQGTGSDAGPPRGLTRRDPLLRSLTVSPAPPSGPVRLSGEVPAWLLAPPASAGVPAQAARPHRSRRLFSERLLGTLAAWVERAMVADEVARRPGLLQRLDPRVKLVSLLALIVTAALATGITVLGLLLGVAVVLVLTSRLGLARFAARAWLFIPLFTAVIMLPAILSIVTPGHAVLTLWSQGAPFWPLPGRLAVTAPGLLAFARLVLRVTTVVSFCLLLTFTTPWAELLKAMRAMGVPRGFVFVLVVAYRYVFTLVRLVQDMALARMSRTVGRASDREDRRFLGATVAAVFGKSQAASEQVYLAMISRGYAGEARTLSSWRLRRLDVVWGVTVAVGLVVLVWFELTAGAH